MSEKKPIRTKMFAVTLLPIILTLKPLAEKFLNTWFRRQLSKWIGGSGLVVSGGSVATQEYTVAIVSGVVAIALLGLEFAASWLAEQGRQASVVLILLAACITMTMPSCVGVGVRLENRDGRREASVFVDLDAAGQRIRDRFAKSDDAVLIEGEQLIEVRPAVPLSDK